MKEFKKFVFENVEVDVTEINGIPMFELYSTGMALGQTTYGKGNAYPNKKRIDKNVENAEIKIVLHNAKPYINESQLYDLMLEMKTDKVKPFRKWITNEVLPQIRTTGGFVQSDREEEFIENYFPSFTDETKLTMIKDLRTQNIKYKEEIATLKPQAEAYQDLMTAEGYLPMLDIAGMVEIGRTKLFEFLRNCKVLTKQSTFNVPAGVHTKNGNFKVVTSKNEKGHFTSVTMVSAKGLNYIYKLLKKKDMLSEFNSDLLLSLANGGNI